MCLSLTCWKYWYKFNEIRKGKTSNTNLFETARAQRRKYWKLRTCKRDNSQADVICYGLGEELGQLGEGEIAFGVIGIVRRKYMRFSFAQSIRHWLAGNVRWVAESSPVSQGSVEILGCSPKLYQMLSWSLCAPRRDQAKIWW